MHADGKIFQFNGTPLSGWDLLDNNPATIAIAAAGEGLFQLHNSGDVFSFDGPPLTGWTELGQFPNVIALIAGGGVSVSNIGSNIGSGIYILQSDGTIWELLEVIA